MRVSTPKLVAIGTWCIGLWATYQFVAVLSDESARWALVAAIGLQALFTAAESAIWQGHGNLFSAGMLLFDALTNVGGLFAYLKRLDHTPTWTAFSETFGLSGGMAPLSTLIVAGVLGILLAAAPELVWRQGGR